MPEIVASVEIARPRAEVFPWLVEPTLLRRWVGGLERLRADGVLRWDVAFRHRGRLVPMRATVGALVVPERLEAELAGPARLRIALATRATAMAEDRTAVELGLRLDRDGLALRLAGGLVERELRATAAAELERLRTTLEEPAGTASAVA